MRFFACARIHVGAVCQKISRALRRCSPCALLFNVCPRTQLDRLFLTRQQRVFSFGRLFRFDREYFSGSMSSSGVGRGFFAGLMRYGKPVLRVANCLTFNFMKILLCCIAASSCLFSNFSRPPSLAPPRYLHTYNTYVVCTIYSRRTLSVDKPP